MNLVILKKILKILKILDTFSLKIRKITLSFQQKKEAYLAFFTKKDFFQILDGILYIKIKNQLIIFGPMNGKAIIKKMIKIQRLIFMEIYMKINQLKVHH